MKTSPPGGTPPTRGSQGGGGGTPTPPPLPGLRHPWRMGGFPRQKLKNSNFFDGKSLVRNTKNAPL